MPSLPRKIVRKLANIAAPHIPLGVYRRFAPRAPLGFMYHAVSNAELPHVKHLYPYKSASEFEADIRWLKQNYTLVGYADLQTHTNGMRPLPDNAAYISFDDGFAECCTVVRPILLKHRVPCLFFLATDWIDNAAMYYKSKLSLVIENRESRIKDRKSKSSRFDFRSSIHDLRSLQQSGEHLIDEACVELGLDIDAYLRARQPFLTRAQIQEMRAEGFVFGGHTRSHHKLGFLPPEEQATEIVESCRVVAEITGDAQVPFAFPFSGDGVDRGMLADLRAQHPHIGVIFDTKKLRQEPGIFHRIWADKPVEGVPPEKNLAYWLHDAYVRWSEDRGSRIENQRPLPLRSSILDP